MVTLSPSPQSLATSVSRDMGEGSVDFPLPVRVTVTFEKFKLLLRAWVSKIGGSPVSRMAELHLKDWQPQCEVHLHDWRPWVTARSQLNAQFFLSVCIFSNIYPGKTTVRGKVTSLLPQKQN